MRLTTRSVSRRPMSGSSRRRPFHAARTSSMAETLSHVRTGHGSTPAASPGRWRGRGGCVVLCASAVVMLAVAAVLIVGAPAAVAASPDVAASGAVRVVALAGSVDDVLNNIRNWIMGILALLATVFLTIGGVRYVVAAGDPGEVAKAKIAFKSAAIGYALAALAPLVVTVLQGIVGA